MLIANHVIICVSVQKFIFVLKYQFAACMSNTHADNTYQFVLKFPFNITNDLVDHIVKLPERLYVHPTGRIRTGWSIVSEFELSEYVHLPAITNSCAVQVYVSQEIPINPQKMNCAIVVVYVNAVVQVAPVQSIVFHILGISDTIVCDVPKA